MCFFLPKIACLNIVPFSVLALLDTVNSKIFARVLFSRNFAYGKFRENNVLVTLSFIDIDESRPCRDFQSRKCVLILFTKIKFSRKFPNLQ